MNGVGMPRALLLAEFGQAVFAAFGEVCFHVGSSMGQDAVREWKDVDVRLLLDDDKYADDGYGDPRFPHSNAKWRAMVRAFSALGREMTGLPIDFQIQQRTWANEKFPGPGTRSGIFVCNDEGRDMQRAAYPNDEPVAP